LRKGTPAISTKDLVGDVTANPLKDCGNQQTDHNGWRSRHGGLQNTNHRPKNHAFHRLNLNLDLIV
jgi:hypothetical protein